MSATHAEITARIKEGNFQTAALSAAGLPLIVERLMVDAQVTDDPDLRRKLAETLHKMAISQEPKAQVNVYAPLNFQIVLDDAIAQVPPPKRAKQLAMEVEDVEPLPPAPSDAQILTLPIVLDEPEAFDPPYDMTTLADALVGAKDE